MVDDRVGAKRRPLLRAIAVTARRESRASRVSARRGGAGASGAACGGRMMGSPSATPRRGGGRKADAKGDAKNRMLFHAETTPRENALKREHITF
jgi:hypothetical protein